MKKYLSIILTGVMALSLAACGNTATENTVAKTTAQETEIATTSEAITNQLLQLQIPGETALKRKLLSMAPTALVLLRAQPMLNGA